MRHLTVKQAAAHLQRLGGGRWRDIGTGREYIRFCGVFVGQVRRGEWRIGVNETVYDKAIQRARKLNNRRATVIDMWMDLPSWWDSILPGAQRMYIRRFRSNNSGPFVGGETYWHIYDDMTGSQHIRKD